MVDYMNAHGNVSFEEKGYRHDPRIANVADIEPDVHHHLHRGLKSRQVAMIAIGGAIGISVLLSRLYRHANMFRRNWFDHWNVSVKP